MSRQSLLSLAYYYKNAIHWFAESLGTSASAKSRFLVRDSEAIRAHCLAVVRERQRRNSYTNSQVI